MTSARWIDRTDQLVEVVEEVREEPAYAIDTEFIRERTYYPRLALIQIAWREQLVLIDPLPLDLSVFEKLLDSDALAVFHAADQDLEVLDVACHAIPRRLFDTQLAAGFLGFSTPSLSTLAERVLGEQLSKGDRLTDWTQRPLTPAQKAYAAADVAHLLELRSRLGERLEASGRLSWVEEECEVLRSRARGQVTPERAWWRLKDGRVLKSRDRLVAQEVCAWRERRAQTEDRPVRFVLPDLAVLTIAQSRPSTIAALAGARGVDGRYTKGPAGKEILDAVERGMALDASALQLPEPDDFDRRLRPALTLISAWVGQLAHDALIDAALLATRADIVRFLRGDNDSRLSRGWRAEVLGSAVKRLVSGDAALAFETDGALVLERRSNEALVSSLRPPKLAWATDQSRDGGAPEDADAGTGATTEGT